MLSHTVPTGRHVLLCGHSHIFIKKEEIAVYKHLLWARCSTRSFNYKMSWKKSLLSHIVIHLSYFVLFPKLCCKLHEGTDFALNTLFLDKSVWLPEEAPQTPRVSRVDSKGQLGGSTPSHPVHGRGTQLWLSRSLIIKPGAYYQTIKLNESLPTSR